MKSKLIIVFLGFLLIAAIFKNWFINYQIIGGDWPFFFKETLKSFTFVTPFWNETQNNGLGGQVLSYSLDSYLYLIVTIFVNVLRVPWEIVYKFSFFGLFLFLSSFSSIYLLKTCFNKINNLYRLVGCVVYVTNTYILMVVGGGQLGIALAYSLFPLVIARFIVIFSKSKLQLHDSIIAGLIFELVFIFDPRIAYITVGIFFCYFLLYLITNYKIFSNFIKLICFVFLIPGAIAVLLSSFWVLPLLFSKSALAYQSSVIVNSVGLFKYFSFADFSHAIALLHPNWPENVFGKIYFMQAEFLILPIIAFGGLCFAAKQKSSREKLIIVFFSVVGLMGAFLSKGASSPFGVINIWLYNNIPGFTMFRDPTKFYFLICLAYSILIPFSLAQVANGIAKFKLFRFAQILLPFAFFLFWLITIHQAFFGQLDGTFRKYEVPMEYVALKNFLYKQANFSRTLWIPRQQRFTFYSDAHPAIEAGPLFKTTDLSRLMQYMVNPDAKELMSGLGVKYLIVPYDSLGEFFLKERRYDDEQFQYLVKELGKVKWLTRVNGFGKLAVFENPNYKDHFWTSSKTLTFKYQYISPVEYRIEVKNSRIGDLIVFSESYDANWVATISQKSKVKSQKFDNVFNSFVLEKGGSYTLDVYYEPQRWVNFGLWISGATLLVILGYLGFDYFKKYE